jgi:PAS domain S-box-containing protein
MLSALRDSSRKTLLLVLALWLSGLAGSGLLARWQFRSHADFVRQRFETDSALVADQLVRRMHAFEFGLRGARGAVISAGEHRIDRKIFRAYHESRDIAREFPGARGFGFVRRVQAGQEAEFVQQARAAGGPDFTLHTLGPAREERQVIQFIEPIELNQEAVGLDIASEPNRRQAADEAMRTGLATITAPITLVQASGRIQRSFLILLPVYRPGQPVDTTARRLAAGFGWSYTPVVIDEVLSDFDLRGGSFALRLTDPEAGKLGPSDPFYGATDERAADASALTTRLERRVFGRIWQLDLTARSAFLDRLPQAPASRTLLLGALGSTLLAGLVWAFAVGRQRAAWVRTQESRLASIVLHASDAIIGLSREGRIVSWNPATERWLGHTEAEVVGRALDEILFASQATDPVRAALRQAAEGVRHPPVDAMVQHRDGHWLDVSMAASPITAPEASVIGISLTLRDIGPRVRAERQLQALTATLEQQVQERTLQLGSALRENAALLSTVKLHALYSVTDAQGTLLDVNDNFCRVSGYSRGELLGRNHRVINSGTHDAAFWRHFWSTISSGQGWRGEICNRAKDGSLYWVESIIAPFLGDDGRIEKYISIRTDITHRREAQRRAHAAEAANQAKSGFLAHISHEIRTPLNAILGLGYLLSKTPLEAEQRQLLQRIDIAGQSLLTLLSNVLDLSKIEHGEMQVDRNDFDLEALMRDLAELYGPQIQARGVEFEWSVEPGLPTRWHGDDTRVRQILMNLLSNAYKFTPSGRIRLLATRDPSQSGQVRLSVLDTGEGIASEVLAGLFAPFAQADVGTTRRHGGTGLGLSIVRRFAELLGGTVGATSEPGRGSHFWVDLPLEPAREPESSGRDTTAEHSDDDAHLTGVHVLVVDDSEVNLDLTQRILEREGAIVTTCGSAAAALRRLQESIEPAATGFDMVLMDVQMPGTDGMEATLQLRQLPGLEALPVLALTAGVLVTERQRALAAGMNDFIAKPFEPWDLVQTMRRHVQARRGTEVPVQPRPRAPGAPRHEWPRIRGIQAEDVAERLGYDVGLFARQLRRLFITYAPEMADPEDARTPRPEPARLHKLRGTAGILGAMEVHHAAAALEHALRADPPASAETVQGLQRALAAALRKLSEDAQSLLKTPPANPRVAPLPSAAPSLLSDADLARLQSLLAGHDLAALDLVVELQAPLLNRLGSTAFNDLQEALDDLDFGRAARCLVQEVRTPP